MTSECLRKVCCCIYPFEIPRRGVPSREPAAGLIRKAVGTDTAFNRIHAGDLTGGGQGVEALEEGQGTGVHGAGLAIIHQQDEGHVLVHDLKGAMEELAGVERGAVDLPQSHR